MKKSRYLGYLFLFEICVMFPASYAYSSSFYGLGVFNLINDVSNNGVAVGEFGLWSKTDGFTPLDFIPMGISGDGTVVSGVDTESIYGDAVRWTNSEGMISLGIYRSGATGISSDGMTIFGKFYPGPETYAFKWTEAGGFVELNHVGGCDIRNIPYSSSADGAIIVGTATYGCTLPRADAVKWGGDGYLDIPEYNSTAEEISDDGSVVTGVLIDVSTGVRVEKAYTWTIEDGVVVLGEFRPTGISSDGSLIVGIVNTEAVYWDMDNGVLSLSSLLVTAGINLDGWNLTGVTAMSPNGSIIAGYGINPDGIREAWMADMSATSIPVVIDIKPSKKTENIINLKTDKNLKVAIVGEESFDALQVDPATVKFGTNEASPVRCIGQDYNRDGFPDLILTFKLNQTGIACGDTEAILTGETYGGEVIEGSDNFTVEPCP